MSIKLEKVVEKFYQNLEEGKITGRKCCACGAVEFPPVYACNECGCWDMEWVEIDGEATMHSIVLPAALSSKPDYKSLGKYRGRLPKKPVAALHRPPGAQFHQICQLQGY